MTLTRPEAKTDNGNLHTKVALRHCGLQWLDDTEPLRVFESCHGAGVVWGELRRWYELDTHWGVDLKTCYPGVPTIDATRVLAGGVDENVVDLDVYGDPVPMYEALLRNWRGVGRLLVFLTWGQVVMGCMTHKAIKAMGLPEAMNRLNLVGFHRALSFLRHDALILLANEHDFQVRAIAEAHSDSATNETAYFALLLEQASNTGAGGQVE